MSLIKNNIMKNEFLYRYELTHTFDKVHIFCDKLPIVRRTPKGCWVKLNYWGREKLVYPGARSSYAQETEREALKHFVRRKTYRNVCIESEMTRNDIAIARAKELIKKEDDKQRKK